MIQRREFLIGASGAVVTLALQPRVMAGSAARAAVAFSKAGFLPLVNSWFDVDARLTVELVQVVDGPDTAEAEQFSLVFRAAAASTLPSGTYRMWHASLGDFRLYLEHAVGDNAAYRADLNLLRG